MGAVIVTGLMMIDKDARFFRIGNRKWAMKNANPVATRTSFAYKEGQAIGGVLLIPVLAGGKGESGRVGGCLQKESREVLGLGA